MARSVTLGTLVTRARRRADKENDDNISTPEVKSLVSEFYGELHKIVVEKGASYFETDASITATGAASYALPSAHLTTLTVRYVIDASGREARLRRTRVQERHLYAGLTGTAYRYWLAGDNIVLGPKPSSGTYKHLYVPQPTDYADSSDGTAVDVINIEGEKLIVWGVASVILHKGSSSQERAMLEHKKAYEELEYWATQRSLLDPMPRFEEDENEDFTPGDWYFQ